MDEIMRNEQAVTVTLRRIDLCNLILVCNSMSYLRKQMGGNTVMWDKLHENLKAQLQVFDNESCNQVAITDEQPHPIKHGDYLIVWIDKFDCWCIYNERGDKVREPYWGTVYEAEQAIESGEAL